MNLFRSGDHLKRLAVLTVALCFASSGTALAADIPTTAQAHGVGGATRVATGEVTPGSASSASKNRAANEDRAPAQTAAAYRQYTTWYGPVTMQPGDWWEAWVYCPSGMQVTGGGEKNSSIGGITLHDTYPLPDSSGWKVKVSNRATSAQTFTVYAVCFSGLSSYYQTTAKASVGPTTHGGAIANCSPSQQVLGGGGYSDTMNNDVSTSNFGSTQWAYGMENLDTVARTTTAVALCAGGVANYQLVEGASTPVGAHQQATAIAYCPAGKWIVGGGHYSSWRFQRMTDSYPDGQAWRVYVQNDLDFGIDFIARAICGN